MYSKRSYIEELILHIQYEEASGKVYKANA